MIEVNQIYHCTALDLLQRLDIGCASLIIADPPYGIKYKAGNAYRIASRSQRRSGERNKKKRKSRASFGNDIFDASWLAEIPRVMHPDGAMYLCTRWDVMGLWKSAIESVGLKVVQRIVWDKALWGAGNLDYFGSQVEDILFCVNPKGAHRLNWTKRSGNVWEIGKGRVMGKDGGGRHPNQKPVDLFSRMISYSSEMGNLVVDPFVGSGASMVAAARLHRQFIGCDIDVEFYASAAQWMEEQRSHFKVLTTPMF